MHFHQKERKQGKKVISQLQETDCFSRRTTQAKMLLLCQSPSQDWNPTMKGQSAFYDRLRNPSQEIKSPAHVGPWEPWPDAHNRLLHGLTFLLKQAVLFFPCLFQNFCVGVLIKSDICKSLHLVWWIPASILFFVLLLKDVISATSPKFPTIKEMIQRPHWNHTQTQSPKHLKTESPDI